jgi:hypothetical protein
MGEASSTPRGVQLLIVGHSHSWCYGGHSGRSLDDYEMGPIDEARGLMRIGIGSDSVKPGYWDAAVDLAKTYRVAVCWQGNQHAGSFMFLEKPFDFALASHPGLVVDKGVDLVPELQVREMFQPSMAPLEMVLRRMLDTGGPRPIVLGTPPPKADNAAIRRGMQVHADFFTKLASDLSLDYEKAQLAPACLRLKAWFLLQQMMRETAERLAVEFWPVSASAMTEEGYLRPEYWAEDATHANAAYGALMLDEYEKRLFAPPVASSKVLNGTGISFDAIGVGNAAASASWTSTETIGARAEALVVFVSQAANATGTYSATVGGISMTQLDIITLIGGTAHLSLVAFGLLRPPTGSQSVVVTSSVSGVGVINSISYNDVSNFGTPVHESGTGSPASLPVSSGSYVQAFTGFVFPGEFSSYQQNGVSATPRYSISTLEGVHYTLLIGDVLNGSASSFSAVFTPQASSPLNQFVGIAIPLIGSPAGVSGVPPSGGTRMAARTTRSGMAPLDNEVNETQDKEFIVHASSEPGPGLLPGADFRSGTGHRMAR